MSAAGHYTAPSRTDRAFNAVVRRLADAGVNLAGAQTLTVTGRRTGRPQRIPVNPLHLDGDTYLVSVRGETQWVRNARADGRAELRRGRRTRPVRLTEVPAAQRAPVLTAYLHKWGWEVGRLLPTGVDPKSTVADLHGHAGGLPVFRVDDPSTPADSTETH